MWEGEIWIGLAEKSVDTGGRAGLIVLGGRSCLRERGREARRLVGIANDQTRQGNDKVE